jgi:hypothetical protein
MTDMKPPKSQLQHSIVQHLNEECRGNPGSPDRIAWLLRQMEEYIDRWIGFCSVPELEMNALTGGTLFTTVDAAYEVLHSEVLAGQVDVSNLREWGKFADRLDAIRQSSDKQDAHILMEDFSFLRSSLEEWLNKCR